jgi:hypothetical protein
MTEDYDKYKITVPILGGEFINTISYQLNLYFGAALLFEYSQKKAVRVYHGGKHLGHLNPNLTNVIRLNTWSSFITNEKYIVNDKTKGVYICLVNRKELSRVDYDKLSSCDIENFRYIKIKEKAKNNEKKLRKLNLLPYPRKMKLNKSLLHKTMLNQFST